MPWADAIVGAHAIVGCAARARCDSSTYSAHGLLDGELLGSCLSRASILTDYSREQSSLSRSLRNMMWKAQSGTIRPGMFQMLGCTSIALDNRAAAMMGLQRPRAALRQRASLGCDPRGNTALSHGKAPGLGSQLCMLLYDVTLPQLYRICRGEKGFTTC
eukprot:4875390-Pleurochrysis_carterae.AAC.1